MEDNRARHGKGRNHHGWIGTHLHIRLTLDNTCRRPGELMSPMAMAIAKSVSPKRFQAIPALCPRDLPVDTYNAIGKANTPTSTSPIPAGRAKTPGMESLAQLIRRCLQRCDRPEHQQAKTAAQHREQPQCAWSASTQPARRRPERRWQLAAVARAWCPE